MCLGTIGSIWRFEKRFYRYFSIMQATVPPGGWSAASKGTDKNLNAPWSPWVLRKLLDDMYKRRMRSRVEPNPVWPNVAVYSIGPNGDTIKYKSATRQGVLDTGTFERYPLDVNPWKNTEFQRFHLEMSPGQVPTGPPQPHAAPRPHAPLGPGDALRGWAAGAVMLALLLLVIRIVERCIDKFVFQRARRMGRGAMANDLAARRKWGNRACAETMCAVTSLNDFGNTNDTTVDFPPPYAECSNNEARANAGANVNPNKQTVNVDEAPPPYSACYVAYSHPKSNIPSVHFYNRRRQNIFGTRRGNGLSESFAQITPMIINEIRNAENAGGENAEGVSHGLIFENGRIVERFEFMNNGNDNVDNAETENGTDAGTFETNDGQQVAHCVHGNVWNSEERVFIM